MDTLVELENATKRYGSTWALRECTLAIPAGQMAGLVGPNGAGKTPLLADAAGLDEDGIGCHELTVTVPAARRYEMNVIDAPVRQPDSTGRTHQGAPPPSAVTRAWHAALFASWLQRSEAPTAEMAAEAITATVGRFGIDGCVSQMAQEFGDHPDAAAERMRWICQLTAEMPAWPRMPGQVLAARTAQPASDPSWNSIHTARRRDPAWGPSADAPHCGEGGAA